MASNVETSVQIEKDIVFGRAGDVDLRLDIYYPDPAPTKRTAIVQLHGGGFTRGAKENIAANCRAFAERGYVAIASQYRLVDQGQWPSQIEDVKAAIRWTRANLERLGVDDDKIAVAGYSAGATLALIAAGGYEADLEGHGGNEGVSSAVAVCLAFYPPDVIRPATSSWRLMPATRLTGRPAQSPTRGWRRADAADARDGRRDHPV